MRQPVEIAVRAYVPSLDQITFKPYEKTSQTFDRVLIFDTETTTDRFQTLKFGSFKILQYGKLVLEGIFFKPSSLTKEEKEILAAYCRQHSIRLMTDRDFVDSIFFPEIHDLEALCIGFNLSFDLSRMALSFGNARNGMRGGFSFKMSESNKRPRLTIKHLDGSKSFISLNGPIDKFKRKKGFRGNFLDLHTLVQALTGENHSLESACELYGASVRKGKVKEHGKITEDYIKYNGQDVDAAYSLLQKVKEGFDLYALDMPITRAYSSASIGKEYLRMMGVKPFLEKNDGRISNETLGQITTTYFGGRSEDKVRKTPMAVTVLDYLSMYPTMCILLGLWDLITCDHIEEQECTFEVLGFIESVTLDDLRHKETWAKLNAMVLVEPDDDILPIRAKFDGKQTYNIGDCHVRASSPLWYALADVANSKIRTGKAPRILRAVRFVPVGKQKRLKPVMLFDTKIDPRRDDFFKTVIEHRRDTQQRKKASSDDRERILLDKKQKALKLIANATSYGIFMEINTEDKQADVVAFGLEMVKCRVEKTEKFGKQNNPFVATFITSAARLVLGAVEAILATHEGVHAFCDTDSMAVPPQYAVEIQQFFRGLNPYDFDAPLFKIETYEDEEGIEHPLENVLFYGISAKRYVLYMLDAVNNIEVLKASSHGLGHLLNPFLGDEDAKDWHKQVWLDILRLHYGKISAESLTEKYSRSFAVSKLVISSPQTMKRFERLNKGRPYDQQIKPFNFCIIGIGNDIDSDSGLPVKPMAPYRKNAQKCPYDTFIDYESGKKMKGLQYWKRFDDVFWPYVNHPEAKFDGDVGVLSRKHVTVNSVTHIGKESNNLEQADILGVQESDYVVYSRDAIRLRPYAEKILMAEPKDVKAFHISQQTLHNVKQVIVRGAWQCISRKTMQRLLAYVSANQ
jgi:hypothetical protein